MDAEAVEPLHQMNAGIDKLRCHLVADAGLVSHPVSQEPRQVAKRLCVCHL